MKELKTYAENTWCPGCGNFGILTAVMKAAEKLEEKGISREKIVISTGIGCHGKIFDYIKLSGLYSIHGRSMATVQGMKIANPKLKPIAFAGDGDALGEGISHLIFAAKRNADITVIVHDNGVYGLTTGQYTPTSKKGFKGRSTPRGSVEDPLNPLILMLEAGATFVARGYPMKMENLVNTIVEAVVHEGFSFVDVLQPCVTYNDTYDLYNEIVEVLDSTPDNFEDALIIARKKDKLPLGIIWQTKKDPFHRGLYQDWNPVEKRISQEQRIEKIKKLINSGLISK
jgi:2-oxoglutarate ferredoxin oxidoreductase subunit beta